MVKFLSLAFLLLLTSCVETEKTQLEVVKESTLEALPLLHIQPEVYTLGDIKEGEAAIATFLVRNNNQKTIELVNIEASCGCTAAEPDSYIIESGGFTQLKVAVDTTAKQLGIKKTIHITDSLGNQADAILQFNVVDNPHRVVNVDGVQGIFDGKCASCHFEPLVGKKKGQEIYKVGCAMCHGSEAEGAYAMSLRGFPSLKILEEGITKGNGKAQMPGFAVSEGGPLSPEQIHALAKWLMSLPIKEN